jgi:hypothetical protein
MTTEEAYHQLEELFFTTVSGNPWTRLKPMTADEFEVLAERVLEWAQREARNGRDKDAA